MKKPLLIVLGGLPGVGKTTLAKKLAAYYKAAFIRVDSIEQSILNSSLDIEDVAEAGYETGFLIAKDNLQLGNSVVADSVNPIALSRQAWKECAKESDCHIIEIELICSDSKEHRNRVERRSADIIGHKLPDWQSVLDREYEKWESPNIVIDTAAKTADEIEKAAISEIERMDLNHSTC